MQSFGEDTMPNAVVKCQRFSKGSMSKVGLIATQNDICWLKIACQRSDEDVFWKLQEIIPCLMYQNDLDLLPFTLP